MPSDIDMIKIWVFSAIIFFISTVIGEAIGKQLLGLKKGIGGYIGAVFGLMIDVIILLSSI
ncbi:hypothetical protein HYX17_02555 [Candidatus Woesearchaeota archaeon]|nr:hypothetical protein [Candidatus Woesearchaeota archaeon]